jgi:hypothetical protein
MRVWSFFSVKIVDQPLSVMDFVLVHLWMLAIEIQPVYQSTSIPLSEISGQNQQTLKAGKSQYVQRKVNTLLAILIFPNHKLIQKLWQGF